MNDEEDSDPADTDPLYAPSDDFIRAMAGDRTQSLRFLAHIAAGGEIDAEIHFWLRHVAQQVVEAATSKPVNEREKEVFAALGLVGHTDPHRDLKEFIRQQTILEDGFDDKDGPVTFTPATLLTLAKIRDLKGIEERSAADQELTRKVADALRDLRAGEPVSMERIELLHKEAGTKRSDRIIPVQDLNDGKAKQKRNPDRVARDLIGSLQRALKKV